MVLRILTDAGPVSSTSEVTEDPQHLKARRNPVCHFGVSRCFCELSRGETAVDSLWTVSLYRCAQCPGAGEGGPLCLSCQGCQWMCQLSLMPAGVGRKSSVSCSSPGRVTNRHLQTFWNCAVSYDNCFWTGDSLVTSP